MKKLRHRKVKKLAPGQAARKGYTWGAKLGNLAPESVCVRPPCPVSLYS